MYRTRAFGNVTAWMLVVVALAIYGGGRTEAATIPFDFSGSTTTSVAVTGTTGGTMLFSLDLGPTDVLGNFNIDIFDGSSAVITSLYMDGQTGPIFDGGPTSNAYGDIRTGHTPTDFQFERLWNFATWAVPVFGGDLPVTLKINSSLFSLEDPSFAPVLTLDLSGDLQIAAVPGPVVGAGLPGLVLAFGGAFAWCRRRRAGGDSK